jgi:hypothetical protein
MEDATLIFPRPEITGTKKPSSLVRAHNHTASIALPSFLTFPLSVGCEQLETQAAASDSINMILPQQSQVTISIEMISNQE